MQRQHCCNTCSLHLHLETQVKQIYTACRLGRCGAALHCSPHMVARKACLMMREQRACVWKCFQHMLHCCCQDRRSGDTQEAHTGCLISPKGILVTTSLRGSRSLVLSNSHYARPLIPLTNDCCSCSASGCWPSNQHLASQQGSNECMSCPRTD